MNNLIDVKIPVLYEKKENCCGCSACYAICPTNSIEMKQDSEGFLYPFINKNTCVKCNQCLNVCVFKQDQKSKGYL